MAITRERKLRTGDPVWKAYPEPRLAQTQLLADEKADVAIVGAGVSGAMLAEELSAAGYSVIMLDKRGPMRGSTAVTTALMQYELDTPLIELADQIGMEDATRAWRRSKLGLESLAQRLKSLRIRCDLERLPSIYLHGDLLDPERLHKEQHLRNSIGLPTEYIGRRELKTRFGVEGQAALLSHENLVADPIKMVTGLLRSAIANGTRIYSPAEVMELEQHDDGTHLITDPGPVITARYVIFATGYEVLKHVKMKGHSIRSTYVIATRPDQPAPPESSLIWEASHDYLYLRRTPDGRLICGGGDEDISNAAERDELLPQKSVELEGELKALMPGVDAQAEYAWTGSFGASETGLPAIGPVKGLRNCYAVLAFGGNGMIFSRIAAEIITTAIRGGIDPEADLFALPE